MLLVVLLMRKKQLDLPTKSAKMKREEGIKKCVFSLSLYRSIPMGLINNGDDDDRYSPFTNLFFFFFSFTQV
jgi:hypothetical protein